MPSYSLVVVIPQRLLTGAQAMVQPAQCSHKAPVHISAPSRLQQAHPKLLPLPRHPVLAGHGILLALHSAPAGCVGDNPSPRRALVLAHGLWCWSFAVGRGAEVCGSQVAEWRFGKGGVVIQEGPGLRGVGFFFLDSVARHKKPGKLDTTSGMHNIIGWECTFNQAV